MEKNWKKRWMAGAMAFALCCTTLLQTGASAVSAAEVGGVSAQSETQIEVQTETQTETQTEKSEEELIEETVADPELALMVTEGEAFDIQNDFTGLKLSEGDHVELKRLYLIITMREPINAYILLHPHPGKPIWLPETLR